MIKKFLPAFSVVMVLVALQIGSIFHGALGQSTIKQQRFVPFSRSTFASKEVSKDVRPFYPAGRGIRYPLAALSAVVPVIGDNVNVIGANDVRMRAKIGGKKVFTCNPGKQTPQNETSLAVNPNNPNNLVGGVNDYRLYVPSENRYDGGGGFFCSTDGGKSWTVGNLPGLVTADPDAPGIYETAGDPAVAAGPNNVFWYANLARNRTDDASAIAVSRSTDGGATWKTTFAIQTSAEEGKTIFNDKGWIAADPKDPNVAYVTWTQFNYDAKGNYLSSLIVYSKTANGDATWSTPQQVTPNLFNQGSVVCIDPDGNVHVVWNSYNAALGKDGVAYAMKPNGSDTFGATRFLAVDDDIKDPLVWAEFRTNSFPAFALDGNNLYVVWSNWNARNADIVYLHSTDGGLTWSSPKTIGGGASDQFFPWIGANKGKVFVSYMDHKGEKGSRYHMSIVASSDNGDTWSKPVKITSRSSDPSKGNYFEYPNCIPSFIGDYTGIDVGSDGVAHPFWTDIRKGNSPGDPGTTYDQDPYTATVTIH